MDSLCLSNDSVSGFKDKESMVDPFLVEALQNPRHRLTILRMELDIQRFLNNADQQHFEFQHFPSSYLRLAAHRVAQHYNMQTMVQDNGLDGQGSKILVRKLPESKYPVVRLSEIPLKQLENDKSEQKKIVIRPRPYKTSLNEANEAGMKGNPVRSVEERKEEYDRARARIFSGSRSSDSCDTYSLVSMDGKNSSTSTDENETSKNPMTDSERCINVSIRDNSSTRVAIFRDREKDRSDPDYDRSYGRYARSIPTSAVNLVPFNLQKAQHSFAQYDTAFNQLGQMPQTQASLGFGPPSSPIMSPFCTTGLNQASRDGAYLQWPSAAMMYAHSYDQFRHAVFQAPFGQQPLSFDYSQDY
ncbi:R3H domain-containing protein 2 isoform X1 [Abrus precatorius]|uniref:R3H domain-containing protein 2 isoform X1 n=1 Tax=Abrus precatorius TaxID=3816 RepID=A0A8B8L1M3_ABRPR|nr:R3H domain-containing protein 2 isoform X1 [Abrus precatorius]